MFDVNGFGRGDSFRRIVGVFVYIWEFDVLADRVHEFLELYGPQGKWARLFARSTGHIGTELLRLRDDERRFVTIDRWESKNAFDEFRQLFPDEFELLDRLGEELTEGETLVGEFETIEP